MFQEQHVSSAWSKRIVTLPVEASGGGTSRGQHGSKWGRVHPATDEQAIVSVDRPTNQATNQRRTYNQPLVIDY